MFSCLKWMGGNETRATADDRAAFHAQRHKGAILPGWQRCFAPVCRRWTLVFATAVLLLRAFQKLLVSLPPSLVLSMLGKPFTCPLASCAWFPRATLFSSVLKCQSVLPLRWLVLCSLLPALFFRLFCISKAPCCPRASLSWSSYLLRDVWGFA